MIYCCLNGLGMGSSQAEYVVTLCTIRSSPPYSCIYSGGAEVVDGCENSFSACLASVLFFSVAFGMLKFYTQDATIRASKTVISHQPHLVRPNRIAGLRA